MHAFCRRKFMRLFNKFDMSLHSNTVDMNINVFGGAVPRVGDRICLYSGASTEVHKVDQVVWDIWGYWGPSVAVYGTYLEDE